MKSSTHPLFLGAYLGFALLFSIQVVPNLSWNSLTNDEAFEITNGYYYLTQGDVAAEQEHVPLAGALEALPLLFLHLQTQPFQGDSFDRSHLFMFVWNQERLLTVTFWARTVDWLFGLAIGFLIFQIARREPVWAAACLILWAFNPTLLAMAGLAKTDIPATFFFFLAVWLYERKENLGPRAGFWIGVAVGAAVTAKLSCIVLIPVFLLFEILEAVHLKKFFGKRFKNTFVNGTWILSGILIWIGILYLPGSLFLPDHQWPWAYLGEKFMDLTAFSQRPYPVFFWGQPSLQNHWIYYPVTFVLKSPLPFVLLLGAGVFISIRKKITVPILWWLTVVVFGMSILPVSNQGIRYLLPAFPFLILIAGKAAAWFWAQGQKKNRGYLKFLAGGFLIWQIASVLVNFPQDLSYFNDLVPSDKKLFLLADSNLDWSQDNRRLEAMAQKRGWTQVKLAYLGGVDPSVYGLSWEPWREKDLKGPQPGWVYLVNASFLQLGPSFYPSVLPIARSWINQMPPTGKVADSWYYFEIPGKAMADSSPFLPSVPFQQYRGYVSYRPGSRE